MSAFLLGCLCNHVLHLLLETVVLLALVGRVVHLLAQVDHLLEIGNYLQEVGKRIFMLADVGHKIEDFLLTLQGSDGIHFVEGILLQDDIVDDFALPEDNVVVNGYTVVAQNIDLFGNLLASLHTCLQCQHLGNPLVVDMLLDIFGKFSCVIGPALYAATYAATGRASLGILSIIVLFFGGMVALFAGRKYMKAEEK